MLSFLAHLIFPSKCDFCKKNLRANDFNRLCLRCLALVNNEFEKYTKHNCSVCFNPLINNICPSCKNSATSYLFEKNTSLFYYYGLEKKMLSEYKFNHHQSYAKIIAYLIDKKYSNFLKKFDAIVPISLGARGVFDRHFCPVTAVLKELFKQELFKRNSKKFKLEYVPCIKRNERNYSIAQRHKGIQERKIGIDEKYFYLKKYRSALNRKKILIVDDVFTTGATLNAVTKHIRENNPEYGAIETFTFFRTIMNDEKQVKVND